MVESLAFYFFVRIFTVLKLNNKIMNSKKIVSKTHILSDLEYYDGMYYIGDIVDMDGDGWVDQETAELILLEYNAGVR
jgi:hypothetical protein